jgi:3-oxoacyl-(acyl-carrier-protein) synthase
MEETMRRCVITGIGIVSPIGISKQVFWQNLLAGETGVGPVTRFDASSYPRDLVAEVKDFDESAYLSARQSKYFGRSSKFAYAAAKLAMQDADLGHFDPLQTDVLVGCAVGGYEALENALVRSKKGLLEFEEGLMDMRDLLQSVTYSPASAIALLSQAEGYVSTVSSSCVSGLNAIGLASERIKEGKARIVFTGGVDTPISRVVMGALAGAGMTPGDDPDAPENSLCPFDQRRTKSVLGEGAGIFILEDYEHARARGACIYAEIVSFAQGSENMNELFMPDRSAKSWSRVVGKAMQAIKKPIGYINAHAPSDTLLDKLEANMLVQSFGERDTRATPISSIKGAVGSPFSAAGAFQVAASALALFHRQIPPNYNYKVPDPEFDLNVAAVKTATPRLEKVLVNGHGLGGLNTAIVLKKVKNEYF